MMYDQGFLQRSSKTETGRAKVTYSSLEEIYIITKQTFES